MHLSQSALSTQIQRIEEALGVQLFDRTTRTVRLTAAGEVFMQQAAALQVAFRDAIAAVSGIASAEHGGSRWRRCLRWPRACCRGC